MKSIWKIVFAFLLTVGGILVGSLNTQAAAKPYEYTFEKDATTTKFNGIESINQLKITLDNNIAVVKDKDNDTDKDAYDLFTATANDNPIYIVQKGKPDRINIIKSVTISGKTLTVTFKNLDFIDYTDPEKFEYELVIDKETLRFDQLDEYRIPFNIYDILPGFKSTFIDTDASIINNNIFKTNAPRDVFVHVPKIFITEIDTIHHYDGIVPNPVPTEDGNITKDPGNSNPQKNPQLTNIDVLADDEATRLKVQFGDGTKSDHSRDLMRRTDEVKGFTMGQAGIDEISDSQKVALTDFELRAYNDDGRFLEQRNFKLKVADPKKDYIINDYLTKPTDKFGKAYSLYELMNDPKLLEEIVTRIPVSQLDSLGITYAVSKSTVDVTSLEELKMALANPKIKTIKLKNNIDLTSDPVTPFEINRDVTIEPSDGVTPTTLTGDLSLKGTDINVRLNYININGDLTVDVGANGTAILDNSSAINTTIASGGVHSVHLNGFTSTNGIKLTNTTPLRIVTTGTTGTIGKLTMTGSGEVTLEGTYGAVDVMSSTTLKMTKGTTIAKVTVDSGQTLTVDGSDGTIAEAETIGSGSAINYKLSDGRIIATPTINKAVDATIATNVTSYPISGTAEAGAKVTISLDEGTPGTPLTKTVIADSSGVWTTTFDVSTLDSVTEGETVTISVVATDLASNVKSPAVTDTFKFDNIAAVDTSAVSAQDSINASGNITIAFNETALHADTKTAIQNAILLQVNKDADGTDANAATSDVTFNWSGSTVTVNNTNANKVLKWTADATVTQANFKDAVGNTASRDVTIDLVK